MGVSWFKVFDLHTRLMVLNAFQQSIHLKFKKGARIERPYNYKSM